MLFDPHEHRRLSGSIQAVGAAMPEDIERLGYLAEECEEADAAGDITEIQRNDLLRAIQGKVEAFRKRMYRNQRP